MVHLDMESEGVKLFRNEALVEIYDTIERRQEFNCMLAHYGLPSLLNYFDENAYCSGGFRGVNIKYLEDVDSLVGMDLDGGVILKTLVTSHGHGENSRYKDDITVTIGAPGASITLTDVEEALMRIPSDAWEPGRAYYW